jgi:hypothetical protein
MLVDFANIFTEVIQPGQGELFSQVREGPCYFINAVDLFGM